MAAPSPAGSVVPAAATVPVEGAIVTLRQGTQVLGEVTTGPDGYFKFVRPASGKYQIHVKPPAGLDLQDQDEGNVDHEDQQTTFLTIVLQNQNQ
ncbi:MAG TPA: SdrD B-like domain-containing protein [Armatimonadota bacterium]